MLPNHQRLMLFIEYFNSMAMRDYGTTQTRDRDRMIYLNRDSVVILQNLIYHVVVVSKNESAVFSKLRFFFDDRTDNNDF